ncbi:hypothetical protein QQS21_000205 [Conoideocrella luteorostrata]|uniref:EXPERA domain-containing protein n=1 Tax=Conoideocrella luteorostrata TaxID=1105319 RepID=A0AAJ0CZ93_9HYPO|nr:hypothetical protein QQS21_000205 [Conoideocrella luteorostrata]
MSSNLRDKLYLPIVAVQLLGMLILDLVPFYPKFLWQTPSSPLHSLVSLRTWWTTRSGDPYYAASTHEPWFESLMYVEGLVQLPLTVYLAYKLASYKPTSGPTELAGLVYGCVTSMGATVCCYDIWHMGPDVVSDKQKGQLFWGTYLPFAVIPAFMAADMYLRLLPRVRTVSK